MEILSWGTFFTVSVFAYACSYLCTYLIYVCVHVDVQSVLPSSLGVLIRAGQEPYREPVWGNVACSKVVSPPFSLPLLPLFLSPSLSLPIHICLHS